MQHLLIQQQEGKLLQAIVDKIVEGYVRSGSYYGNLALLASCYAARYNKGILSLSNLNSIFDPQDKALLHYMWGYIISSSALGVLQARIDGDNIVISNVYTTLQQKLEEVISTYIDNSPDENAKVYNQKLFDNVKDLFNEENRMIDVYWFDDVNGSYKVEIEILANDRNGLLKDVIKQVENAKVKLTGMNTRTTKEGIAIIDISLELENKDMLNKMLSSLRNIESVYDVNRKRG